MIFQSLGIGILFGTLWGRMFSDRYKQLTKRHSLPRKHNLPRRDSLPRTPSQTGQAKSSAWFLASTSVIRYLLLAALLVVLLTKKLISLPWWTTGFMASFWLTLVADAKHSPTSRQGPTTTKRNQGGH